MQKALKEKVDGMQEQTRLRQEAGTVDRGRTSFALKGFIGQLKLNRCAGEMLLCV